MTVRIAVSATVEQARELSAQGPRRDFVELAEATQGEFLFQGQATSRTGLRAKLFGPHLRQAWTLARRSRSRDRIFADGEHIGLPLLLFLAFRRSRPSRVVILGHLMTRRWKLLLLWLGTRIGPRGVIVVHSTEQAAAVRSWLSRRWSLELVPYQVDTAFWNVPAAAGSPNDEDLPLVVAVGSEHRDYDTLVQAVRGLPSRVVIAAGSHWARRVAGSASLPPNVAYEAEPLSFARLRDLYREASVVVVPLRDVSNQSGVTTILEAFSMGVPVIVTASRGQRECVRGPLATGEGFNADATADRGPELFTGALPPRQPNGIYVPPHDSGALRAALEHLFANPELRIRLGAAGRETAMAHFTIERYIARLAALLESGDETLPSELVVTA